jgi:hypothetical protein
MSTRELSGQISDIAWARRLRADHARAERNQDLEQRTITAMVMFRALELGATGFALTGSTARRRRTTISDLDYHVIGVRPDLSDLSGDIDVVAVSPTRFRQQLTNEDDFPQWTLRYGCILYDTGVLRDGARLVLAKHLWPSGERKLESLTDHRRELERLILMGDRDAAHGQVRAALTTAGRGLLLVAGVFPLSRSELPGQLRHAGYGALSRRLDAAIHEEPDLADLAAAIPLLEEVQLSSRAHSAA